MSDLSERLREEAASDIRLKPRALLREAADALDAAEKTNGWRTMESYEGGFVWLWWGSHAECGRTKGDKQRWYNNYGHEFSGEPLFWQPLPLPPQSQSAEER